MQYRTHQWNVRGWGSRVKWLVALAACVGVTASVSLLWHATTEAAGQSPSSTVRPLFDLGSPERSPFPSDVFSVTDDRQNTGRRVNLPTPQDCATHLSDCEDVAVLNQLDGFNMQARISVPFDGDIDPASVTRENVFLLELRDAVTGREDGRQIIGINYIVWDPATRELSSRPDTSLEQHTTYALVVTTGVRDRRGNAIGVAHGLRLDRDTRARDASADYRRALDAAARRVRPALARGADIAAMSVFTTQTFSHIVDRMHDAIQRAPAPTLNFDVGANGERAVFDVSQIESLTNNVDIDVAGPLTAQPLNLAQVHIVPNAVGKLGFGTFRTLDFTTRPSGHVTPIATRTGRLVATGSLEVAFNLWLPSGAPPAAGWPVAIYGHGSMGNKNGAMAHAAVLASHGVAVLAINGIGRGGGPRTTMTVQRTNGTTMTFAAPGLGWDQDGDGQVRQWEPRRAARPHALLNTSGSIAQGVAQHFALVRAIQAGVDVDDDGVRDLDGSRIFYLGQSFGSVWGMLTFAYEPALRAAVFAVAPGTPVYGNLVSIGDRPAFAADLLGTRIPPLLNAESGAATLDGRELAAPHFNDNLPLRGESPRVNTIAGARAIQRLVDHVAWATQFTNTVAFAPLLRRAPLPQVPARPFIFQWARSDRIVANPSAADLIRSGAFADRVAFYRHDLNFGLEGVPADSHAFLSTMNPKTPNYLRVALGAQHQIGVFFASDGTQALHPTPTELWEWPLKGAMPEDLFFLPRAR